MRRRRFDHLTVELSVAVGQVVPRYALWLRLQELGWDPDFLPAEALQPFFDDHLAAFLGEHGLALDPGRARRLQRRLERFDPRHPTPEETLSRMFSSPR